MALSRPKRGFESRWGRHNRWQIHYAGQQSIKCNRAFEGVPDPSRFPDRREAKRTDEQGSQDCTALGDVPMQEPAPVSQLRA